MGQVAVVAAAAGARSGGGWGPPGPALLAGLVPGPVEVEERIGSLPDAELHPAEAAVVARAVDRRRREFAAGRACARAALARLGVGPAPLLPLGADAPRWARGAPRWPDGVVGSLTHCAGAVAAAVGRSDRVAAVGIDVEAHLPLPRGVEGLVARPEERAALAHLGARWPEVAWSRVLFSAKESVYKAWFPLTGRWLGFGQCRVTLHPGDGTFAAELLVPGPLVAGHRVHRMGGRWRVRAAPDGGPGPGHLATAVAIGAGGPA